jgi:hypothetical protein
VKKLNGWLSSTSSGRSAVHDEEIGEAIMLDRYLVGMFVPERQEPSPEGFDELPNGSSGLAEDGAGGPYGVGVRASV